MAKIYYPAVFHKEDNDTYWVEFPDLPGCLTQGKSFNDALCMADDVLGHRDTSPDLDGDGIVEPEEWTKMCPCFDAKEEYSDLLAA